MKEMQLAVVEKTEFEKGVESKLKAILGDFGQK